MTSMSERKLPKFNPNRVVQLVSREQQAIEEGNVHWFPCPECGQLHSWKVAVAKREDGQPNFIGIECRSSRCRGTVQYAADFGKMKRTR